MATNTLNVRMKQAVRTEAEWISANPVLLEGEVAYSSDKNNIFKVGDGTKTWSQLSYNNASTVNGHTVAANVPSNAVFTDTDTKVTNTLGNTTKAYLTGTTSASTNTGTQVFDSGVYVTTTAGQLNATTYKVNEKVTLQYDTSADCLNFVFN